VRGGSNPGSKRSGPADGTLPVEVHLHSWVRGRAQSGAEVVRSGSYPVSRIVPKKPSRMPPPGGLVRVPTEPRDALRKDLVPLVPKCVLCTFRVASPAQDKAVRGGLNQGPRRSGPVHGALSPPRVYLVGLFDLDPLLPLLSPAAPAQVHSVPAGGFGARGGSAWPPEVRAGPGLPQVHGRSDR
jgi:hypothetical protein